MQPLSRTARLLRVALVTALLHLADHRAELQQHFAHR
jgi:hypothetical protein